MPQVIILVLVLDVLAGELVRLQPLQPWRATQGKGWSLRLRLHRPFFCLVLGVSFGQY